MQASPLNDGQSVDLVAKADIQAGDVVVHGEFVLVAKSPIAAGQRGGLCRTGGFAMTKAPGEEIPCGTRVYWDERGGQASARGELSAGVAMADAAADDETVAVLLGS